MPVEAPFEEDAASRNAVGLLVDLGGAGYVSWKQGTLELSLVHECLLLWFKDVLRAAVGHRCCGALPC